ncbi:unnamed protein product [Discula destructiva]
MDFLNKLKHGEESHEEHSSPSNAQNAPAPTTATDDDSSPKFLSKLTSHHSASRAAREQKAIDLAKREAALRAEVDLIAKEKEENQGFFHKLHDAFDKEAAQAKVEALEAKETALKAELKEVEREKKEEEGLLERLKDHLDGDDEETEGKPPKSGEGHGVSGFLDKITGKAEEEERRRKEEESKGTLEKIQDRINEGMGGGRKAEEKEDLLDKTIDGFQEHILRKGDQDDESAVEQLKDEKIAGLLRKQLHLKESEEKE